MSNIYNKTGVQALEEMHSSSCGLSAEEAAKRAEQYGPNKLSEGKKKSIAQVFAEQFKDLLVIILIVAALISAVSDNLESTIVIFAVLILNAILGTVQYVKAEKQRRKGKQHEQKAGDGVLFHQQARDEEQRKGPKKYRGDQLERYPVFVARFFQRTRLQCIM